MFTVLFIIEIVIWGLLTIAALIDLQKQILPDLITLPAILLCIAHAILLKTPVIEGTLNFLLPALSFLLLGLLINRITKKETFGLGDVKLLIALGGLLGYYQAFISIFLAALTALLSLGVLSLLKKKKLNDPVAFGFYLTIAAGAIRLWGGR